MAQSVVKKVIKFVKEEGIKKVTQINIEIGEYSFLNEEQLEFGISAIAEETEIEGVDIRISKKDGKIKCSDCGYSGPTKNNLNDKDKEQYHLKQNLVSFECPECGETATEIVEGREVKLKGIEVEE